MARQKQKRAWSDVLPMACFARALTVQLGQSDAEKKPQPVTEVLPGLLQPSQTEGHFCNFADDFFSPFFFLSAEGEFLSRLTCRPALVLACFIVVSRAESGSRGGASLGSPQRLHAPAASHTLDA